MDPWRRVIDDGAVAVQGDRIVAVGPRAEVEAQHPQARQVISAREMAVLPGLIDGHSHAGHSLVKTLGADRSDLWYQACETIYAEGSDEAFWQADALLTGLERLKFGTTCAVTFLGGGSSVMRTDDPVFGSLHCQATAQLGLREFLAVGPRQAPFPRRYARWEGSTRRDVWVHFQDHVRTCETLIERWHGAANGRIHLTMAFPTHHPERQPLQGEALADLRQRAQTMRALSRRHGLRFTQDGHRRGSVRFAHQELDLLGPDVLLSHATDLTEEEVAICAETGTRIVHNPSAVASMTGRCPVPELLDAGVTVMLGSDATAPDRSSDMFRHMFQAMRYHRRQQRDPLYLPPGKALEMVTIDAAHALGLEHEIGSLEVGKKADLILVDLRQAHLYPPGMPVHRLAYFANGHDVHTVMVDGRVLMRNRAVQTVDEDDVLDQAARASQEMLTRSGLAHLQETPDGFWGRSRYPW
ncbi:MAG: amidohydrolase family protein [Chloroflexi bacterium]|nr:amidohydrolase family protein [Chloroflexota bacterium]